jgi:hypothetical protein
MQQLEQEKKKLETDLAAMSKNNSQIQQNLEKVRDDKATLERTSNNVFFSPSFPFVPLPAFLLFYYFILYIFSFADKRRVGDDAGRATQSGCSQ